MQKGARLAVYLALAALVLAAFGPAGAEEGKVMPNRLAGEKSPYLLKHADNPVDWYPWGEEAFDRARMQDKPVFLSIGYSTCHWCNVMEEESFSDAEVAALMNEVFISIKVDREERPEIDGIYMAVAQMLTGSGGWPLTIIMTPEKKPFFAATYIPKESRFGRIGMMDLIPRVRDLWAGSRTELLESADKITASLKEAYAPNPAGELGAPDLEAAFMGLLDTFDYEHGGFGRGMKFPMPHNIFFLLRYHRRTGSPQALEMAVKTLEAMRRGGIYDQLGFGFHRYSTDPQWLVPHFEKMLYDQALLALAYTEAYQATGKEEFGATAREILKYVLRDMTSKEGAFYSAQGADSPGGEGAYYLWSRDEVRAVLDKKDAALAIKAYGIEKEGNFKDQLKGERTGVNVLHAAAPLSWLSASMNVSEKTLARRLESVRQKLYEARLARSAPETDDKVLTDLNGIMIAALARASAVFGEPEYLKAADRAADFVLKNLTDPGGRLLHRWRDGQAAFRANADDYAFLTWGLIELYEAGFDADHLEAALSLTGEFMRDFWDEESGGLYFAPAPGFKDGGLIVRARESTDGALPSSNSVAMLNLLRLSRLTGKADYESRAARIAGAFAASAKESPTAHTMLLSGVDFIQGPSYEVVIAGPKGRSDTEDMLKALRGPYLPSAVAVLVPSTGGNAEAAPDILKSVPYAAGMKMLKGKATAYVCRDFKCDLPTTSSKKMLQMLMDSGNDQEAVP